MANIYFSATGDDPNGNGSSGNPYQTVEKCLEVAAAGDSIIGIPAGSLVTSTAFAQWNSSGNSLLNVNGEFLFAITAAEPAVQMICDSSVKNVEITGNFLDIGDDAQGMVYINGEGTSETPFTLTLGAGTITSGNTTQTGVAGPSGNYALVTQVFGIGTITMSGRVLSGSANPGWWFEDNLNHLIINSGTITGSPAMGGSFTATQAGGGNLVVDVLGELLCQSNQTNDALSIASVIDMTGNMIHSQSQTWNFGETFRVVATSSHLQAINIALSGTISGMSQWNLGAGSITSTGDTTAVRFAGTVAQSHNMNLSGTLISVGTSNNAPAFSAIKDQVTITGSANINAGLLFTQSGGGTINIIGLTITGYNAIAGLAGTINGEDVEFTFTEHVSADNYSYSFNSGASWIATDGSGTSSTFTVSGSASTPFTAIVRAYKGADVLAQGSAAWLANSENDMPPLIQTMF